MERWEIRSSPNDDDPLRHLLLMRGGVSDVAAVLKRFGALCGRPTPLDGDDFNLSLVLHKVTPVVREKLDDWLTKMAPKAAPVAAPVAVPVVAAALVTPPPVPALAAFPPMPELLAAPSPPPSQSFVVIPPPPLSQSFVVIPPPPLSIPMASSLPPPADILLPIPMPPAAKEPLISLGPDAVVIPPAASAPPTELRMATPPPVNPAVAVPAPAAVTAPAADSAPVAVSGELRADWTFETLLVGAYNRFAHAAAMSVVSSPGSMYNPLFLYGAPGAGKSHLLHAIATTMSKGLGTANILVTSGARLSRAISIATATGTMAAIDKKVADSKAIFVDDIHLLSVTDQNKDLLAKVFKSFFDRSQQVVITSMYPPKALGTLEEALKFNFSKGWSVDLKIPSPNVQRDLVASVADRVGTQMNGDECGQLADKLTMWGYADLTLWAKRLATLRKMRAAAGQPTPLMDLLRLIYEPIVIGTEAPAVVTAGKAFTPPPAAAGAEALAIIVPKGQDGLGAYAAALFHEMGAKNGFTQTYRHALVETYDAMQQVGVPFQIADMCLRAGVTRVLLVGPGPDSPLAPRANEFGHAVRHILESVGVLTGWIPHNGVHIGALYVNAHLDFEK